MMLASALQRELHERIECPYNKSHKVLPLRMPYHLHKCRKNHPDIDYAVCPYNALHEMRAPELKYHMPHCPDRNLLERDMPQNAVKNAILGKEEAAIKGNTDIPLPLRHYPTPNGNDDDEELENWDEDVSPLFVPQGTPSRTRQRNNTRRHLDGVQLRRPQRQSIAASYSLVVNDSTKTNDNRVGVGSNYSCSDDDNNNTENVQNDNDDVRERHSDIAVSAPQASSVTESSNSELSSNIFRSQLLRQPTPSLSGSSVRNCIVGMNYLSIVGRGRARPACPPASTESPPMLNRPGSCPNTYLRMGRGALWQNLKS